MVSSWAPLCRFGSPGKSRHDGERVLNPAETRQYGGDGGGTTHVDASFHIDELNAADVAEM